MEKAILVGLVLEGRGQEELVEDSMEELKNLASSAGALVLSSMIQERLSFDPKYLLGKGKVSELAERVKREDADLVIFDQELSPSQQGNIEEICGVKVLDRTGVILDIFAQRARTSEGKLQVELAQLKYLMPRLVGRHRELSRLGGGIGTRGPGEKKIEMDRRRIKKRMVRLESELEKVKKHRALYRTARKKASIPVVTLVGYTNAGKSTLLYSLTGADVTREGRLFSTLDPTTRRLRLASGGSVLLTDTVGFIRHIPHQLIAAFKSTLEEVLFADIILHVIDLSRPDHERQGQAVRDVLADIGAGEKKILDVYNKVDLVRDDKWLAKMIRRHPDSVFISAGKKMFLESLLDVIDENLVEFYSPWRKQAGRKTPASIS